MVPVLTVPDEDTMLSVFFVTWPVDVNELIHLAWDRSSNEIFQFKFYLFGAKTDKSEPSLKSKWKNLIGRRLQRRNSDRSASRAGLAHQSGHGQKYQYRCYPGTGSTTRMIGMLSGKCQSSCTVLSHTTHHGVRFMTISAEKIHIMFEHSGSVPPLPSSIRKPNVLLFLLLGCHPSLWLCLKSRFRSVFPAHYLGSWLECTSTLMVKMKLSFMSSFSCVT